MNRRNFLCASAAFTSLGLLSRGSLLSKVSQPATPPAPPPTPAPAALSAIPDGFIPIRRNVGIFNARGGTIGWLATPDALVVIDTQFPDTAARCLAGLPHRDRRQLDAVINTHHHGDHTGGNPVFKPVSKTIIAHKNVPALQRAAAARMKPPTLENQVCATTLFADTLQLELPGAPGAAETIHARHHGPAHTGGDIIVHFEKANIVHMGDLVFNRLYPVIDRAGGASIANWIKTLETAHAACPADAICIYGHGNPSPKFGVTGNRDDLLAMRDYLAALLEHTRAQIAAGKTRAEILTLENLPGFPDHHTPRPNRLASNLGVAYDELTHANSPANG